MFIPNAIRTSPAQTGIPLARHLSDKPHEAEVVPHPTSPGFAIIIDKALRRRFGLCVSASSAFPSTNSFVLVKLTLRDPCALVLVAVIAASRGVLYVGTLATIWTTAPSLPQRPSVQLAAVCLFLATLTIAARCYASSSATHPLVVQFSPTPSSFSPIDNSNAQVPHSSNLVLNRLLTSPHLLVQSDTSVILINSKKLLHNQNSNPTTTTATKTTTTNRSKRFRTKRELKPSSFNRIFDQAKRNVLGKLDDSNRLSSDVLVPIDSVTTINDDVGDSDTVNSLLVTLPPEAEHQNDSSFLDEDPLSAHAEGTQRPMPPVHDHGNASSVSDLGILVLVLSAIVLTVALGLITCVLSHYRPITGEGAADGGTAADPHDAARAPTTAPMLSVVSAGAAAGVGGMDRLRGGRAARELAATRDRQVRLHAVHTDIAINLPPNIGMPDGEEHPFTSSRLHIRDPEQESEIHQKCIRPPPNRTVLESESPPPYRSSSACFLSSSSTTSSSSGGGGDWSGGGGGSAPLVVRCHSMSSSSSSSSSTATNYSTSSSSSKRPEAGSSGQKTDFLHRTVKIFTGGKKGAGSGGGTTSPSVQTLPVVIVPTRPRRTSSDQQGGAATTRPKPSV